MDNVVDNREAQRAALAAALDLEQPERDELALPAARGAVGHAERAGGDVLRRGGLVRGAAQRDEREQPEQLGAARAREVEHEAVRQAGAEILPARVSDLPPRGVGFVAYRVL